VHSILPQVLELVKEKQTIEVVRLREGKDWERSQPCSASQEFETHSCSNEEYFSHKIGGVLNST